jgi:predicted dinucleotide-binding enzyme
MKPKIAIIGRGNVGGAIARGLTRAGYAVSTVGNEPQKVGPVAADGDVVFLAVPFARLDETLKEAAGALAGKVVVDVTNVLTPDHQLALGCTTSGAEQLQRKLPSARVVKAFNTVFAQNMSTGKVNGTKLALFAASDDAAAKQQVLNLGGDIGFDPVDAGPLQNARWLETLGYFNIQLGYAVGMGPNIGFALIH